MLDHYTLHRDSKTMKWRLEREGSDRAKRTYGTKREALASLRKDLGTRGGSVRIRKVDNSIQEERTYPRSQDPVSSPG